MMPKYHILFGFLFSLIIFFLFPQINILGILLIFLSSVFIDLDHIVRYSIKTKNFNPFTFWKWSVEESKKRKALKNFTEYKYPQFFLHGIEFVLFLIILSWFCSWAFLILIGILFHLILDYIDLYSKKLPLLIKISQIWVLIRNKNKKKFN